MIREKIHVPKMPKPLENAHIWGFHSVFIIFFAFPESTEIKSASYLVQYII